MKLMEVAPLDIVVLVGDWESLTWPLRNLCSALMLVMSHSLLANPVEELSTWEAACLAVALPVREETTKPSPVPTEQLLLLIA